MPAAAAEPGRECPLCPRLVALRRQMRQIEPRGHNAPVPSFGDPAARLLIVGLAPGLQGANRTGRPFTGDWAGELLYETLCRFGFAVGTYDERPDDGLRLVDCLITNAVRCVPPANKPTGTEIAQCRPFLAATLQNLPRLEIVLALGRIAHDSALRLVGARAAAHPFVHGARHRLGAFTLHDSYHCSRYNTNTGRLTKAMFLDIVADIRERLGPLKSS